MTYFIINVQFFYGERIASNAEGDKILHAENYFWKMNKDEIILDPPLFDFFYLKSFDKKEYWEWKLCDVHKFIGEGSQINGWLISDRLKELLEKFKIAPKYHFYESRLLYREKKIRYWIFQFPINPYQNIDFERSEFELEYDNKIYNFKSVDEYLIFYRKEYKESKRKLMGIKNYFKSDYDLAKSTNNDFVVSEKLKQKIEEVGIEGFEFSKLYYEVIW